MITTILPKFIFTEEQIITLKDHGIKMQEGLQTIGDYRVPCFKFFNVNESDVCNEIERNSLLEATDNTKSQLNTVATRMSSVLFLKIRQVNLLKDKNQRLVASCALLSSVNTLALINPSYANRFINLVRAIPV